MKKGMAWPILIFLMAVLVALFSFQYALDRTLDAMPRSYESYDRHYAMITAGEDEELWDRIYESALAEGKERGVYVERFGEQLAGEYGREELIKIAIQASVDGIIVPGDEDEETIRLLNQAVEEGIPVVTVLRDSGGSLRQCFVGNNSYHLGQEYGRQIVHLLGERMGSAHLPMRVLVLTDGSHMDSSQETILLGIRETVENELGGEDTAVVETMAVDNSRSFGAEESIRDIFLEAETLPDILVCTNALYTRCAYQAAVDYNQVGAVQLIGYYDSEAILDAVAKNIISATFAPNTGQIGQLCVQALEEYAQTGYTNNYMAVDVQMITSQEASRRLAQGQSEEGDALEE